MEQAILHQMFGRIIVNLCEFISRKILVLRHFNPISSNLKWTNLLNGLLKQLVQKLCWVINFIIKFLFDLHYKNKNRSLLYCPWIESLILITSQERTIILTIKIPFQHWNLGRVHTWHIRTYKHVRDGSKTFILKGI